MAAIVIAHVKSASFNSTPIEGVISFSVQSQATPKTHVADGAAGPTEVDLTYSVVSGTLTLHNWAKIFSLLDGSCHDLVVTGKKAGASTDTLVKVKNAVFHSSKAPIAAVNDNNMGQQTIDFTAKFGSEDTPATMVTEEDAS